MTGVRCPRCAGAALLPAAAAVHTVCAACKGPLLVEYDLARARAVMTKATVQARPADMWRYRELLPVQRLANVVTLGEGMTPLLPLPTLGAALGLRGLLLKDEGTGNPTATFKARGAAAGVSRARELGITDIAMPTNGNAGGAWAAYCARAGIRLHLAMPDDAPPLSVLEASAVGAAAFYVGPRGLISDAGAIIAKGAQEHSWFEASTLKEPYRIEGKKTMGFEIAEQLGWKLPDAVLYPTGGGVGLIGLFAAFQQLLEMGWVAGALPRLIAVQPTGCAPIVRAFHEGKDASAFFEGASTLQQGTRVPKALGDFLVLRAVRATGGTAVTVTDNDALWGMGELARKEGAFICPEGAALVAAARDLRAAGLLSADEKVVLLNTGAGIKCHHEGGRAPRNVATLPVGGRIPACSAAAPCAAPCSCGLAR